MEKKVIFLSTSDIQRHDREDSTNLTKVKSTGVLEEAIAQGYLPVIISTRTEFGPHDVWWQKRVNALLVFSMDEVDPNRPHRRDYSAPWRQAFKTFNLEWPTVDSDSTRPLYHWSVVYSLINEGRFPGFYTEKALRKAA
jgi:hypothetical protein